MNPIPEPDELLESECNAQGPYGLPPEAFAAPASPVAGDQEHDPQPGGEPPAEPRPD